MASKTLDCWELQIGHEIYLFLTQQDAVSAGAAMIRGAQVYSPANPLHKERTVGLSAIEVQIRRRPVPVLVANGVAALGFEAKRLIQNNPVNPVDNKAITEVSHA